MVAQRMTKITPPAATPDQLWQHGEATWSAVPQEHIQSLFESMPRRVAVRYRTLNCNKTTMYYSIDMNFFYSKDDLVALHFKYDFWHMTATAGSDVVQSGRPIFDDFFQHLWPYIGNNTANVVFQIVKRLGLIRIDQ
ncbi:adhesion G protein-coupled receptor B2 [Trichonephila clavipes]|nr:adhesion G protein-coupled receptor B2 [Trichonephila clavipes]